MKQYSYVRSSSGIKSILLLFFILFNTIAWSQSPYPYTNFYQWQKVKLKGGILACSGYDEIFRDDFNGTQLDANKWDTYSTQYGNAGRFHEGAESVIFKDENVVVKDGNLELTVKKEDYTLYPNPGQQTFTVGNYPPYLNIDHITRQATSGMVIYKDNGEFFNLGKYEMRCKLPDNTHAWTAFWMNHNGTEIDIMDIGFTGKINMNSFNNNYISSVHNAPCCSEIGGCDFCSADSHECTNCNNCSVDFSCDYLSNGFHTIGCEWTPFELRFYIDDKTMGTIYRYYYEDKTPVVVTCNGEIPDKVVYENPSFARIIGTGFRPWIWITAGVNYEAEGGYATINYCKLKDNGNDLPQTLYVDHVYIWERMYERISLVPECYSLCKTDNLPFCVKLDTEPYNFGYKRNNWGWNNSSNTPRAQADIQSWSIPSNNGEIIQTASDKAYFKYLGPDCTTTPCKRQMKIQVNAILQLDPVTQLNPVTYTITKLLTQPEPKIYTNPATNEICIDRDNFCGPYDIVLPDKTVNTIPDGGQAGGLNELDLYCIPRCSSLYQNILKYNDCGEIKAITINSTGNSSAVTGTVTSTNGTTAPLVLPTGINYVPTPQATVCITPFYNSTSFQLVDVQPLGGAQYAISVTGNCFTINFSGHEIAAVRMEILVGGCTRYEVAILGTKKSYYKAYPNPTTGIVNIEATVVNETILLPDGSSIQLSAKPEHLRVFDGSNATVIDMPLDENQLLIPINLPSTLPSGNYTIEIKDKGLSLPQAISIKKQ